MTVWAMLIKDPGGEVRVARWHNTKSWKLIKEIVDVRGSLGIADDVNNEFENVHFDLAVL